VAKCERKVAPPKKKSTSLAGGDTGENTRYCDGEYKHAGSFIHASFIPLPFDSNSNRSVSQDKIRSVLHNNNLRHHKSQQLCPLGKEQYTVAEDCTGTDHGSTGEAVNADRKGGGETLTVMEYNAQ